jgi:hypothetical protein
MKSTPDLSNQPIASLKGTRIFSGYESRSKVLLPVEIEREDIRMWNVLVFASTLSLFFSLSPSSYFL